MLSGAEADEDKVPDGVHHADPNDASTLLHTRSVVFDLGPGIIPEPDRSDRVSHRRHEEINNTSFGACNTRKSLLWEGHDLFTGHAPKPLGGKVGVR
jgi:hypothetical protein